MKIIIPQTINLLASNVTEELCDDWDITETYNAGDKCYILYSDFEELITYGNCIFNQFETDGDEWTYDGNALEYDCDGTQAGDTKLYQTISKAASAENYYLTQFEIKNYSAGNVVLYAEGATGTNRGADGVYQEVVAAGLTDAFKIGVEADENFIGSITNISVKKIGGEPSKNIYEAQQGTTGDFPPDDIGTNWIKVSASNRWKMFDKYINSQTTRPDRISVKLKADKCDSFAIFLTEATKIRYALSSDSMILTSTTEMTISTGLKMVFTNEPISSDWMLEVPEKTYVEIYQTSNPQHFMIGHVSGWIQEAKKLIIYVEYDEGGPGPYTDWTIAYVHNYEPDLSLYLSECMSYRDYFWKPIRFSDSKSQLFTVDFNTSLRIILTGASSGSMIRIGHLLVGTSITIGKTQYGIKGGIKDYSTKETNEFGEQYIYERDYSKKPAYEVRIPRGGEDKVFQTLSQLRATLCVFDGNNDDSDYSFTVAYGILSDWELTKDGYNETILDLEILGSTQEK